MSEIKIKIDDNKGLVSSLDKRTKMLEKLLAKKEEILKASDIARMINDSKGKEMKSFKQTISSLSSALGKMKQPQIKIEQVEKKDNSSELARSLNKRISLLESLIKKMKKSPVQKIVYPEMPRMDNGKLRTIEKNTNLILESLSKQKRGISVIPSPS